MSVGIFKRVRRSVEQERLLAPGEGVVVGVSGGPDSLCLLHLLRRLQVEYDLSLHVAHLHHGLRGAEADADATFVRQIAAAWELPCTVERVDVPALAAERKLAVEEAARQARYAFLRRVAAGVGAQTVAVGHNADDQAETVLMHFIRGSGLSGLRGMLARAPYPRFPPQSPDSQFPNSQSTSSQLTLIRPLLDIPRADILAYCDRYNLTPRFDRSNLDTTYFRNWLRHEVLPLLARHNPNVSQVLRRTARVLADEYALLRSLLAETWPRVVVEEQERIVLDRAAWQALPIALQRSVLREAIHRLRRSLRDIGFVHVENALRVARDGATGDRATLPRGLMLTVEYGRLLIADADAAPSLPGWPLLPPGTAPVPLRLPGATPLPGSGWRLAAEMIRPEDLPAGWRRNADPWQAFLDGQAAAGGLALRTRRPGDRFQPLGLGGHTVKLADFLTNRKVPRAARDRLPLLVTRRDSQILWVCGQRLDERAAIGPRTERVLRLRFESHPPSASPSSASRSGVGAPSGVQPRTR